MWKVRRGVESHRVVDDSRRGFCGGLLSNVYCFARGGGGGIYRSVLYLEYRIPGQPEKAVS